MTLYERFLGLFSSRADAAPTALLPGPTASGLPARNDSVFNAFTGLGGPGDKGAIARPNPFVIPLSDAELRALYATNGLARKIVDLFPTRATRKGWTAPELEAEHKRLRVWGQCTEAMIWARLHGGSALLMVTEDDVPPAFRSRPDLWLQQPLDLERVGALKALQVFDALEAIPRDYDRDISSPTYRLPRSWFISAEGFSGIVDASRIVYFRGSRRPPSELTGGGFYRSNRMPDAPYLQVVWDEIRRLTETMQGGATLAQELRESVLKIGGLGNLQTADEAAKFAARMSLLSKMKGILGIYLLGENDTYENRSNPPTGFEDLSDAAKSMLAAVTGIPEIVLFGSAPGGLNTDGDSGHESFRQEISDYQERQRHEFERICEVMYAAQDGPTGGTAPDEWALTFHPLDEPDQKEVAEVRLATAQADAAYINVGVLQPEDVREGRFGPEGWQQELVDLEPLDEPDEEVLAKARAALEAQQAGQVPGQQPPSAPGKAEPPTDPKADAIDPASCCVLLPAADPGLRAAVEKAIGQVLAVEGDAHVTLLYLGAVADPAPVVEAVTEVAEDLEPMVLERGSLRAFPPGPDGTPIVVEFDRWPLESANVDLLRRTAHLIVAEQHARFRPHLTVGYAPQPLSPEAASALLAIDASGVRVPIGELRVMVGAQVVASVPVGS